VLHWLGKGLATGLKSSRYPAAADKSPGVTPGRPVATRIAQDLAKGVAEHCPQGCFTPTTDGVNVDYHTCIFCSRCRRDGPAVVDWHEGYEWGVRAGAEEIQRRLVGAFGRSLHIRFVDAGACGACMSEARLLNNPYYNMHRLGLFTTATPRQADILLVAGPLSDAMRKPLREVYEAMPEPKRVIAMGVCAISGGVFGRSFASAGGIDECIPVDVVVPGCPPPPLAILHGILLAVERVPPSSLVSTLDSEISA
jgi:Ni,Fe-hydrogenase III small subunit/ferredoxin-like protein FixX